MVCTYMHYLVFKELYSVSSSSFNTHCDTSYGRVVMQGANLPFRAISDCVSCLSTLVDHGRPFRLLLLLCKTTKAGACLLVEAFCIYSRHRHHYTSTGPLTSTAQTSALICYLVHATNPELRVMNQTTPVPLPHYSFHS